jgi:hypothetical protein
MHTFLNAAQFLMGAGVDNIFYHYPAVIRRSAPTKKNGGSYLKKERKKEEFKSNNRWKIKY